MEEEAAIPTSLLQYIQGKITFTEWEQINQDEKANKESNEGRKEIAQLTSNVQSLEVAVKETISKNEDLEITKVVDAEPSGSMQVKIEPEDMSAVSSQDEKDDDVVYLGTEVVLKYLAGEITFAEFNAVLEEKVKNDPDLDDVLEVGMMEEVVTSLDPETSIVGKDKEGETQQYKKVRKQRQKLPKKAQGLMGEANIRFARGQKGDAIKLCMEVIKMAPNAPEPYQTLGMIYEEDEDFEKGLQFQLIGAHLSANDADEWVQLAEMSLEHNNISQAISCYDRAIKVDCKNTALWWARSDLLEKTGEKKKALDGYVQILGLMSPEEGDNYFKLARDLISTLHTMGEHEKAQQVLTDAFNAHPMLVNVSDINMLLEMNIAQAKFEFSLLILVRFCGVNLEYADGTLLTVGSVEEQLLMNVLEKSSRPNRCVVSNDLPIDLRGKLAVCLIHLQYDKCVDEVIAPLMTENPEDIGDLYLDVAEAFTDKGKYSEARPLLFALVQCENYDLAAVWLKYAECLHSLGSLKEAVLAFKKVIELAPSHMNARLSLSAIQQQLGRTDEALQVLQREGTNDEEDQTEIEERLTQDLQLSLPKCMLLHSQKKWGEFISTAMDVLFGHFPEIFLPKVLHFLVHTRSAKHRLEVDPWLEMKLKTVKQALSGESAITHDNLWDLFLKLCEILMQEKRYKEMEEVAIAAYAHPSFSLDTEKLCDINFIVIHACLLSGHGQNAFDVVRELCLKDIESNRAWNLFAQIIAISQNIRHNRFCLRLMFKYPDHKALGILNGHNALVAGTYKHALAEYITAFRSQPQDPFLSFCIGIVFIHLASQKFAGKRHSLTVQACAFLNQYLELRGECQETYYNLGRAMHQLGLLHAAIYYYQLGLECPNAVPEKEMFDLSKELAFNLCLIYKNSGSYDMASLITQKYLQV